MEMLVGALWKRGGCVHWVVRLQQQCRPRLSSGTPLGQVTEADTRAHGHINTHLEKAHGAAGAKALLQRFPLLWKR